MEEYGATFKYIEGKNNVLADAFSRLPSKECDEKVEDKKNKKNSKNDQFYSFTDDKELLDCFLNLPQEMNRTNQI